MPATSVLYHPAIGLTRSLRRFESGGMDSPGSSAVMPSPVIRLIRGRGAWWKPFVEVLERALAGGLAGGHQPARGEITDLCKELADARILTARLANQRKRRFRQLHLGCMPTVLNNGQSRNGKITCKVFARVDMACLTGYLGQIATHPLIRGDIQSQR